MEMFDVAQGNGSIGGGRIDGDRASEDHGGGQMVGPYRLGERLGVGGMGEVFRAFDERLLRSVALKQILPAAAGDPVARDRFRREARSAARLDHPGIVRIYDLLDIRDGLWIVMELLDGASLAVERTGPLPLDRTLDIAIQITEALACAHGEGIVHRDLKASNVFITSTGRVKLLDFGLAKPVGEGDGNRLTADGAVLGTPRAMSPEQAVGRKVDLRSDLFSLGSLLYELISGMAPFRAGGPIETLSRICTYQPPPLDRVAVGVPAALTELVQSLLEKNRNHRPKGAAEVGLRLMDLRERGEGSDASTSTPRPGAARAPEATMAVSPNVRRPTGERRPITAVCCELVASDATDPLQLEALFHAAVELDRYADTVPSRFAGHVASRLGHLLLVYFGYPEASEDDAQKAVRMALDLRRRLRSSTPAGREVAVRIGIHTGVGVLLRVADGDDHLTLGATLESARRLPEKAAPDQILVSAETRRLIEADFVVEPCASEIDPVGAVPSAFCVVGVREFLSHWQQAAELPPMVARDSELALLLSHWRRAEQGRGQVVVVNGEAGIGKTRLVQALRGELGPTARWLDVEAAADHRHSPFQPILELIRRVFRLEQKTGAEEQLERLVTGVEELGLDTRAVVPRLAPLLSLPVTEERPLEGLLRREKTLEALCDLFLAMSADRASLLVVEDFHWLDPSSVELLEWTMDRVESAALMVLVTSRPSANQEVTNRRGVTHLDLARIRKSDAARIVDRVTGGRQLPREMLDQILLRTDGIPIYVEEMTKDLLESGPILEGPDGFELSGNLEDLAIPSTLQGSLTARLDRLGEAKHVATFAATLGRVFSYDLLAAALGVSDEILNADLERLVEAGIVHRKGFSRRRRYRFKHALLQEAAGQMLLESERRECHRRIVRALREEFPSLVDAQPETLAHHLGAAGSFNDAIAWWQKAGRLNLERSANAEAIDHLGQALKMLSASVDAPEEEIRALELELLLDLGSAQIAVEAYSSGDVEQTYTRARALSRQLGESPQIVSALFGLFSYFLVRSKLAEALELARQLLDLGEATGDRSLLQSAHVALGNAHFFRGELAAADHHLAKGIELEDAALPPQATGQDMGVTARTFKAQTSWLLGEPERALAESADALERARHTDHPFTVAFALFFDALVHRLCGRYTEAGVVASETIDLAEEHGFVWWLPSSRILEHSAKAAFPGIGATDARAALDGMASSYDFYVQELGLAHHTLHLALRIEGALLHGHLDEARRILGQALKALEETEEAFYRAEIYRLQGEIERRAGSPDAARRSFGRALEIARRQGAHGLVERVESSRALVERDGQDE